MPSLAARCVSPRVLENLKLRLRNCSLIERIEDKRDGRSRILRDAGRRNWGNYAPRKLERNEGITVL